MLSLLLSATLCLPCHDTAPDGASVDLTGDSYGLIAAIVLANARGGVTAGERKPNHTLPGEGVPADITDPRQGPKGESLISSSLGTLGTLPGVYRSEDSESDTTESDPSSNATTPPNAPSLNPEPGGAGDTALRMLLIGFSALAGISVLGSAAVLLKTRPR